MIEKNTNVWDFLTMRLFFIILLATVFGYKVNAQQTIKVIDNSTQEIVKEHTLPHKIFFKKKEKPSIRTEGYLLAVNDNKLLIRNRDTTEYIDWRDIKWVQFKRVSDEGFYYDVLLLGSYWLTATTALLSYSAIAYENGGPVIGFTLFIALPINIALAKARFREFTPEKHTIKY